MTERKESAEVILVTGSRAPAALEVAWRLHWGGYEVVTADSTSARLCRGLKFVRESCQVTSPVENWEQYLSEISSICEKWTVRMVVPSCEEVFHLARGRAGLPEGCELYAPSFSMLRELHDKLLFAHLVERLEGGKVRVPRSFSGEGFDKKAGAWVVKPRYSRFGSRVRYFESGTVVVEFLESVTAEEWMVQEWVKGEVRCSYALTHDGEVMGGVVYGQLAIVSGGAASAFEVLEDPGISEWVVEFVAKHRLTGQVAFDFLIDDSGQAWVIECNPRATSGVHLLAGESDLGKALLGSVGPVAFAGAGVRRALKGVAFLKNPRVAMGCEDVFRKFYSVALIRNQVSGLWHFFREARKHGCSMPEASVRDIEWNGGVDE